MNSIIFGKVCRPCSLPPNCTKLLMVIKQHLQFVNKRLAKKIGSIFCHNQLFMFGCRGTAPPHGLAVILYFQAFYNHKNIANLLIQVTKLTNCKFYQVSSPLVKDASSKLNNNLKSVRPNRILFCSGDKTYLKKGIPRFLLHCFHLCAIPTNSARVEGKTDHLQHVFQRIFSLQIETKKEAYAFSPLSLIVC